LLKAEAVTTLLTVLVSDARPEARAAAAETLSLLVLCGEVCLSLSVSVSSQRSNTGMQAGQLAFLVMKGLPLVLQQLADDISGDVRRHCASIVQSCGANFPSDILAENGLQVRPPCSSIRPGADGAQTLLNALALDATADVRALCANALAVLFGAEPAALRTAAAQLSLVDVLRRRIGAERGGRGGGGGR
jgi:hypothetical protein